jgi:hypothetical protein
VAAPRSTSCTSLSRAATPTTSTSCSCARVRSARRSNLAAKFDLRAFRDDLPMLLPPGTAFDFAAGATRVLRDLIARLPGKPWQGRPQKERRR